MGHCLYVGVRDNVADELIAACKGTSAFRHGRDDAIGALLLAGERRRDAGLCLTQAQACSEGWSCSTWHPRTRCSKKH